MNSPKLASIVVPRCSSFVTMRNVLHRVVQLRVSVLWPHKAIFSLGSVSKRDYHAFFKWREHNEFLSKLSTEDIFPQPERSRKKQLKPRSTCITVTRRSYTCTAGSAPPADPLVTDGKSYTQSTTELYESLRHYAVNGRVTSVVKLVSHMVQNLNEAPNRALYASMILANVDKSRGSAAEVARILREMEVENIQPDNAIYHDVLKVLAVHPDGLLRGEVIQEMRSRWHSLSVDGWHDVVAGFFRGGQLEIGLEWLNEMLVAQVEIQPWLYELAIYMLCDSMELDEGLDFMRQRVEHSSGSISEAIWFHLFEVACEKLHMSAIRYVWYRRVEALYLNPSNDQCIQVLTGAARTGDVPLAMSVFWKLKGRGTILEPLHYELLMQAYRQSGDLKGILWVTSIMEEGSVPLTQRVLEPLFNMLTELPGRPEQALILLKEMAKERKVPTATFNCLIDASVEHNDLERAIEIYKQLHEICTDGADTNSFNALFRGCRRKGGKSEAMFFAAEMLALNIQPNSLTYDRLLLVCLEEQDHEDALRYYDEMRQAGFLPRPGTWRAMIQKLATAGDQRAWGILAAMEGLGLDTTLVSRRLQEIWEAGRVDS